jgi:hypothetical protein
MKQHWKDLDPIYIQSRWIQQENTRVIIMSAALFGTLAWFFLMAPIVQCAWILSKGGRRLVGPHVLMASVSCFSLDNIGSFFVDVFTVNEFSFVL